VTNGRKAIERKRKQAITNDKRRWPRFLITRAGLLLTEEGSNSIRVSANAYTGWVVLDLNNLEGSLQKALEEQRREYRRMEKRRIALGAA
jgi:hypothetical protein